MTQADDFAKKVLEEVLSHRTYELDGLAEREWMDAIKKVIQNYQCPDCMFSMEKGHRS